MPKRVIAIASGGGHWVQLRRLRPAWEGAEVTYVTTRPGYQDEVTATWIAEGGTAGTAPKVLIVPDANRWQKLRLVRQLLAIAWLVFTIRPHAIVTTGAAPGYFAIRFGNLIGARTVWCDSIANGEELSLSGKQAGPHADLWLTQWPEVARQYEGQAKGPRYEGAVL